MSASVCATVGEQHLVVAPDGVVRFRRHQKVARDQPRALMDELVEGVLPVGARLAPDDRARRVPHRSPVPVHALAVALHVTLLKIRWETMHVLVVG